MTTEDDKYGIGRATQSLGCLVIICVLMIEIFGDTIIHFVREIRK